MFHNFLIKMWKKRWIITSFHQTMVFNFRFLPINQAIKFPILCHKTHFNLLGGNVKINSSMVKFGMIILGKPTSPLHSNRGLYLYNKGKIRFNGKCTIGNDCRIVVGNGGYLEFGDGFQVSAGLRMNCSYKMKFGTDVLMGFDCYAFDTDFHHLTAVDNGYDPKAYGEVEIGDGCWIAFNCVILKNTSLPEKCVIASNSLLNRSYDCPPCTILAGMPAKEIKNGYFLDHNNHVINYEYHIKKK